MERLYSDPKDRQTVKTIGKTWTLRLGSSALPLLGASRCSWATLACGQTFGYPTDIQSTWLVLQTARRSPCRRPTLDTLIPSGDTTQFMWNTGSGISLALQPPIHQRFR